MHGVEPEAATVVSCRGPKLVFFFFFFLRGGCQRRQPEMDQYGALLFYHARTFFLLVLGVGFRTRVCSCSWVSSRLDMLFRSISVRLASDHIFCFSHL